MIAIHPSMRRLFLLCYYLGEVSHYVLANKGDSDWVLIAMPLKLSTIVKELVPGF